MATRASRPGAMVPVRRGFDRGSQHPVADFHDEPGLFGDGQELAGRRQRPSGRRQRSRASTRRVWSVVASTSGWNTSSNSPRSKAWRSPCSVREFCGGRFQQRRAEDTQLAASQRLGAEQRRVRGAQQRLGIAAVIGIHAGADADADHEMAAIDAIGAETRAPTPGPMHRTASTFMTPS